MKKNTLARLLHRAAPKPKLDIPRLSASFAKFADNPAVRWENQQQRDLAFIGGILSHGEQSVPVALAVLPTLKTLAGWTPEEAMQQGKREWQDAMERLSREVLKLGGSPQGNMIFTTRGTPNVHNN